MWTKAALDGVARAQDYLHVFNPRAAVEVAQNILDVGNGLVNFPHRGRIVPKTTLREIVTAYPYIIRYRITGDLIVILRVRHMSRRRTNP